MAKIDLRVLVNKQLDELMGCDDVAQHRDYVKVMAKAEHALLRIATHKRLSDPYEQARGEAEIQVAKEIVEQAKKDFQRMCEELKEQKRKEQERMENAKKEARAIVKKKKIVAKVKELRDDIEKINLIMKRGKSSYQPYGISVHIIDGIRLLESNIDRLEKI